MTGGWFGYVEAGWGPEETVAAPLNAGVGGREAGAAGSDVIGAGTAAGPMPGPMALASCLLIHFNNMEKKVKGNVRSKTFGPVNGRNLLVKVDIG